MKIRSRSELYNWDLKLLALVENDSEPTEEELRRELNISNKLKIKIRKLTLADAPAPLWTIMAVPKVRQEPIFW